MAWVMDTYSMHDGPHGHRGRHRQAGGDGRLARASRSDGARLHDRDQGSARAPRHAVKGTTVAVQGFGNVGSVAAQLLSRRRVQDRRDQRRDRRRTTTRPGSTSTTRWRTCKQARSARGLRRRRRDHERRAAHARRRRAAAGRARERDHEQERREDPREDHLRRRERPDDRAARTRSSTRRASSSSRTSWPTPAASRSRTSSGCRIAAATSGRRTS